MKALSADRSDGAGISDSAASGLRGFRASEQGIQLSWQSACREYMKPWLVALHLIRVYGGAQQSSLC